MLKGHGDDGYTFRKAVEINFSSNIYSTRDFSALYAHLATHLPLMHTYPEPDAHSLATHIADRHGIQAEQVSVTNGATEAIYLIAQMLKESQSTIVIPTFGEYEDACSIHHHSLRFCTASDADWFPADVVWLCNPNNPDGYTYDIAQLELLVKEHPTTIFICDQSYQQYSNKQVWSIEQALQYSNLILLHSMTKQYAIPGLRLGYLTAHHSLIERISSLRMPWSVNALAIEAGHFLLNTMEDEHASDEYLKETARLQQELGKLNALTVFPSDTHFFLCKLNQRKASDLKVWLMEKHGILIRDAGNFRGLDEQYFRIATQLPEENNRLIQAVKEWL